MARLFTGNYGSALGDYSQAAQLQAQAGANIGQALQSVQTSIARALEKDREREEEKAQQESRSLQFQREMKANPELAQGMGINVNDLSELKVAGDTYAKDPNSLQLSAGITRMKQAQQASERAQRSIEMQEQRLGAMLEQQKLDTAQSSLNIGINALASMPKGEIPKGLGESIYRNANNLGIPLEAVEAQVNELRTTKEMKRESDEAKSQYTEAMTERMKTSTKAEKEKSVIQDLVLIHGNELRTPFAFDAEWATPKQVEKARALIKKMDAEMKGKTAAELWELRKNLKEQQDLRLSEKKINLTNTNNQFKRRRVSIEEYEQLMDENPKRFPPDDAQYVKAKAAADEIDMELEILDKSSMVPVRKPDPAPQPTPQPPQPQPAGRTEAAKEILDMTVGPPAEMFGGKAGQVDDLTPGRDYFPWTPGKL